MPKPKREEAGSFLKSEFQKLKKLYTQGGAAYGSLRNLVESSNLLMSKLRQFMHSKSFYTQFTRAARKFKQLKAFSRFKNENWCTDVAYVDKLGKDSKGVKYLLLCLDLFDRIVDEN